MYEITMEVGGMMCGHCEATVNDAIRNQFNVRKVSSDHTQNRTVVLSDIDIADEDLKKALEPTGHEVGSIVRAQVESSKPGGLFGFMNK